MSRSNHPRKPKNRSERYNVWYHGGWILEDNRTQRRRIKREVDKALRYDDYEVIVELKGPKNAYDYP